MPEWRKRGFPTPSVVSGHPLRSICFDIPDVEEYRQALWGHLWQLGKAHVWQRDSTADTKDQEVAAYWREVLNINYQRWLEFDECAPDSCRIYSPSATFIEWFPNNPFMTPDLVPDGYIFPPWYISGTISSTLFGAMNGDVLSTIERFPAASLPDIVPSSGLPRFRVNVSGAGTVKLHLVNIYQGSICLIQKDSELLTLRFVDLNADAIALPPESPGELTVEVEFSTPGLHYVDCTIVTTANDAIPFVQFGGGLRAVELCGFETMPVATTPFRFTAGCGLEYYDGDEWLPVDGWDEFAPGCFTGASGENLHLRENLATGLEQDSEPTFATPTLIHAYYRADALRAAVRFYARDNAAELILKNTADVTKLRLGIVGAVNELDTRESQLLMRFGSGATNTRRMYFNGDGTVQLINSVIAPSAKFEVYNDVSALDVVKFEGRTGQATGTAVIHAGVLNQESAGTDGDAIRLRGLNSVTATRAPGILKVDKHGRLLNTDYHQLQVLTTGVTPQIYKLAYSAVATLAGMSGTSYRSIVALSAYKDGVIAAPALQLSVTAAGAPSIGFNGQPPIAKQDIAGTAEGNQLLFDLVAALATVGLLNITTVTLGINCCEAEVLCRRWNFQTEPFNSDWNIVDGEYTAFVGWENDSISQVVRLNMFIAPDIEINELRLWGDIVAGTGNVDIKVWDASQSTLYIDTSIVATSPFSVVSTAITPPVIGDGFYIQLTPDIDLVVALTAFEVDYLGTGGEPSGGDTCIAEE